MLANSAKNEHKPSSTWTPRIPIVKWDVALEAAICPSQKEALWNTPVVAIVCSETTRMKTCLTNSVSLERFPCQLSTSHSGSSSCFQTGSYRLDVRELLLEEGLPWLCTVTSFMCLGMDPCSMLNVLLLWNRSFCSLVSCLPLFILKKWSVEDYLIGFGIPSTIRSTGNVLVRLCSCPLLDQLQS